MLGQETRDLGAMFVQQGYKSSFMILYGHSRLDRPNEKFGWVYVRLTSNVEEVIEQKPAEKENRMEQRQDDKYLILFQLCFRSNVIGLVLLAY